MMISFSPTRTLRIALAPLLMIWLAGAGCILGCESMSAVAATRGSVASHHHSEISPIVASGDACASSESKSTHDCCKKKTDTTQTSSPAPGNQPDASLLEFGGSSSGTMNGCPLAMSRAVVVAKPHNSHARVSPATVPTFRADIDSRDVTAPLSAPLRLPNRGHTYLRCCTFLI